MNNQKLNLARKWRSQNFDQVVGQQLSVRMLKNSLYLGHYFPVYLFSGQRGCGKTSTARIFAAAINCEKLEMFKSNPHDHVIPCQICASCQAMSLGKHPDFIEMDAASHTGVDNIRAVIEAASFMPLMGNKKIYLIDEAHMLSKAAFNAFLKILEEPPVSVIFILATTDPEKIIDTVRSRCFQLVFKPINNQQLVDHLQHVCLVESIAHDRAGLELIVKESEGSARDALNMLEQVRFGSNAVTLISVSQTLGHIDDRHIFQLLKSVLLDHPKDVIQAMNNIQFGLSTLDFVWKRMIEIARGVLWYKYGIKSQQWSGYESEFQNFSTHCSAQLLHHFLYTMHKEYDLFVKTTAQHAFLEMICIGIAQKRNRGGTGNSEGSSSPLVSPVSLSVENSAIDDQDADDYDDDSGDQDADEIIWKNAVAAIITKADNPLLATVLQQAVVQKQSKELVIYFPKDLQFFADVIDAYKNVLKSTIEEFFGVGSDFATFFTLDSKEEHKKNVVAKNIILTKENNRGEQRTVEVKKKDNQEAVIHYREQLIDISDKEYWKKAHMILEFFPGRITEICEKNNEQQV